MVDIGDLGILAANYGTTSGMSWENGDFNGDGTVDIGDLGILAANYGSGSNSSTSFDADWVKVSDLVDDEVLTDVNENEETSDMMCRSVGLSLVVGIVMIGIVGLKLNE